MGPTFHWKYRLKTPLRSPDRNGFIDRMNIAKKMETRNN